MNTDHYDDYFRVITVI